MCRIGPSAGLQGQSEGWKGQTEGTKDVLGDKRTEKAAVTGCDLVAIFTVSRGQAELIFSVMLTIAYTNSFATYLK